MWQRLHILTRTQVFILAAISAAVIALAVAVSSIPADGTSWNRFLGPSRQLDPFINFGLAFVSVLPVLLGYYHLGRIGIFIGLAFSGLSLYVTGVYAFFVFVFGLFGRGQSVQEAAYAGNWLLFSALLAWVHIKLSKSRAILDAQRVLHLTCAEAVKSTVAAIPD